MTDEICRAARGVSLLAGLALPVCAAAAGGQSGSFAVDCAGGRLSIEANHVSVRNVLTEISRRCGLTVNLSGALDDTVSVHLQHAPLQLAAKRILRERSFVLNFAQPPGAEGNWLWVLPDAAGHPGDTEVIRPLTGTDSAEVIYLEAEAVDARVTARLRDALADTNSEMREAAAETLGELASDEAAYALAVLLTDPDSQIRESTADALGEIGGEVSMRYLRQLLADGNPVVREAAEDSLSELLGGPWPAVP